jgi:hypothetical protein
MQQLAEHRFTWSRRTTATAAESWFETLSHLGPMRVMVTQHAGSTSAQIQAHGLTQSEAGALADLQSAVSDVGTAIAAELEESFRQRWVEKRASELIARGLAADLARTQAFEEFKTKYNFSSTPAR